MFVSNEGLNPTILFRVEIYLFFFFLGSKQISKS